MISFFTKNKKITVDCFTHFHDVYEYAKIDHAIKYIPEWWKNTPQVNLEKDIQTIKKCPAFLNFYKRGIVIPSWFEFEMLVSKISEKENMWKWHSSSEHFDLADSHANYQFENFTGDYGQNFKITSPWVFKTKDRVEFSWSQPTWNMRENIFNFCILPAVMNFKDQHATNINCFFEYKKEETFIKIDALTPLVVLHPLSERPVEIKNHLVSKNEWDQLRTGVKNFFFSRNTSDRLLKEKKKLKFFKKIEELRG
jgi:hypothetical protein